MRPGILMVAAAAGILGCAPPRYVYTPVITTGGELEGAPAAVYDVPPGSRRGEARLAMLGVSLLRPGGSEDSSKRAIHVALALSNRSDETWTVDPSEQHVELTTRRERDDIYATTAEVARSAPVDVLPRSTRLIELYFPLPIQLQKANELPSFDVHWTVHAGSRVVAQRTRFQRFLVGAPPVEQEVGGPRDLDDKAPSLPGGAPPDWRHVLPSGE